MALYLNASAVAAAIGQHPYKSADEAFLEALAYEPRWRAAIDAAKRELSLCTESEAFSAVAATTPAVAAAIETGVAAAAAASSDADVAAAIRAAVTSGVDAATATATATADLALVAAGITQAVQMARGVVLESAALDRYEKDKGAAVTERNARMVYLRTPAYVLGGRIDGYDAARKCVVEIKNRKRFWATPPAYDLIQLRVYVKMLQEKHGDAAIAGALVERFPDGTTRETPLAHDDAQWSAIHDALLAVRARYDALTLEDVTDLVQQCCVPAH